MVLMERNRPIFRVRIFRARAIIFMIKLYKMADDKDKVDKVVFLVATLIISDVSVPRIHVEVLVVE